MAVDYITNILAPDYEKLDFYDWGFIDKKTNKMIGRVSVYRQDEDRRMADLVWFINGEFSGNGYTTEAVQSVVDYLIDEGFERIEAFAHEENYPSLRIMEKVGMQYEGTLRKYDTLRDGTLYNAKMYSLIK